MRIAFSIAFLSVLAFILSCDNKDPNYPITPYIELRDFKFIKGNLTNGIPDSLKFSFYLRDGDFDIGIDDTITQPPFNPFFFFNKKINQFVSFAKVPDNVSDLIVYPDRRKIDTLPSLRCSRWLYNRSDTIYFIANRNMFSISADLYVQGSTTAWEYPNPWLSYPWYVSCEYWLDVRLPRLNGNYKTFNVSPITFKQSSSKEGIMTYTFCSGVLSLLLHGKEIKLKIWVKDRALHSSNIIETPTIIVN